MQHLSSWINNIVNGQQRLAIPIMTHPGIEFIGATVKQSVTDGNVHFKAIQALNERYHPAATTVIMDLTVEAEAFGAQAVFPDNEIPAITGRLLDSPAAIEALKVPDLQAGRILEFLKANRLAVESIKDKPVLSGCIGPFSLAGRLYDMSEMMMLCYCEPEAAKMLLQKCTDFLLTYCRELKRIGTDGVIVAEPAAGLMSNEDCDAFSSRYVKQMVEQLQDERFMVVLHNCGNTGHCTPAMLATGAAGYHFGNKINMLEALDACPADVLVMGNLDPVSVFKMGAAEEVRTATLDLLHQTASYKNFILSSGCDTPPHVPVENIEAFFQALQLFNKGK